MANESKLPKTIPSWHSPRWHRKHPEVPLPAAPAPKTVKSNKADKTMELGIEFCIELVLVFYQLGRELMGLPVNVPLGAGCWAVAMLVAIRILWILPLTAQVPRYVRAVCGILIFVIAGRVSWHTVSEAYRKEHAGEELSPDTKVLLGAFSGMRQAVDALKPVPLPPAVPLKLPPFSAEVEVFYPGVNDPDGVPPFWTTNGDSLLCRVHLMMFIRLVNLQSVPALIDKFNAEVLTTTGRWVKLRLMDTRIWKTYTGTDLKALSPMEAVFLDSQIVGKSIPPKGPVRGWVFYDYPDITKSSELTGAVRITVSDFTRNKFVSDPTKGASGSIQRNEFIIGNAKRDFSHIPETEHCGLP